MNDSDLVLLDQRRVAELLHVTGRTLERLRAAGAGPVFVRVGKRPLYRPTDIAEWLRSHTYRSTSDPEPQPHRRPGPRHSEQHPTP